MATAVMTWGGDGKGNKVCGSWIYFVWKEFLGFNGLFGMSGKAN